MASPVTVAVPWWYDDPSSEYSEETMDPELTEKRKVWNATPKAANSWRRPGESFFDPDQPTLSGMCPECGSTDYELEFAVPTKQQIERFGLKEYYNTPFTSGWYFSCPDCGNFEGYSGPVADKRLEIVRNWDWEQKRKWEQAPGPESTLFRFDQDRYDHDKSYYQDALRNPNDYYYREPTLPDPADYARRRPTVDRASEDQYRDDFFYNTVKGLVDQVDTKSLKELNYKPILKRVLLSNYDTSDRDYIIGMLDEQSKLRGEEDVFKAAVEELRSEISDWIDQFPPKPNYLGNNYWNCECPTCNRRRGQRQRHKRPLAVKLWREMVRDELSGNYRSESFFDPVAGRWKYGPKQWTNYYHDGVKRFLKNRGWEDLNYRQVMGQISRYQPSNQELRRAPFGIGNIYDTYEFEEALEVKHDPYDWRSRWDEYWQSAGSNKEEFARKENALEYLNLLAMGVVEF